MATTARDLLGVWRNCGAYNNNKPQVNDSIILTISVGVVRRGVGRRLKWEEVFAGVDLSALPEKVLLPACDGPEVAQHTLLRWRERTQKNAALCVKWKFKVIFFCSYLNNLGTFLGGGHFWNHFILFFLSCLFKFKFTMIHDDNKIFLHGKESNSL